MQAGAGPTTLGALFSGNVLKVPSFQRAFAWNEEPQLRNFIEDIRNHAASGGNRYFFGTILLTAARDIGSELLTGYAIVDGQQRLTTACIFVACSLSRLRDDPKFCDLADEYFDRFIEDRLRTRKFSTISEDDDFFQQFIIRNQANEASQIDTPSKRRLLDARSYFSKQVSGLPTKEVAKLVKVLFESQILVHAVDSDAEATQMFELQNDRGMRLTDLEALKSFLMHGLYLHAGYNTAADLQTIQGYFAAIYRAVERMEGRIGSPDEDQLLSYHCIAFEDWVTLDDAQEGWRKPKQLVQWVLRRIDPQNRPEWIKNFARRLKETYDSALDILDARDHGSCEPFGELTVLRRVAPFWPLILKCWKSDRELGRPSVKLAVAAMRRFAFRAIVAGKRSDTGDANLRVQAREFSGDFSALNVHLGEMATWWSIPAAFEFNLQTENFYSFGPVATYILWKYENSLRTRRGRQLNQLSWRTVIDPENHAIMYAKDHIEPKNPTNPNLARMVKWDPADTHARPFQDVFLNRLGNLVLDNIAQGAAKGDRDFASRINQYSTSGFVSQVDLVEQFATRDSDGTLRWDDAAIRKRQAVLVAFSKDLT